MMIRDMSNNKGFTLIELVMVIVIIGILAAAAFPRFANLTTQARTSSHAGIKGALRAAVNIVHAAWLATGETSPVTVDGGTVDVGTQGWPDGNAATAGTPTAAECATIPAAVMNGAPEVLVSGCTANPCYNTSASGATCTYTEGTTSATITYNVTTGAVG